MLFSAIFGQDRPNSGYEYSSNSSNQLSTLNTGHKDAKLAEIYILVLILSVIKA